jgi:hypothetical protein
MVFGGDIHRKGDMQWKKEHIFHLHTSNLSIELLGIRSNLLRKNHRDTFFDEMRII